MVYRVLWCNMLPIQPGTQGRTPSLFDLHWVLLSALHNTWDQPLSSHPKDEAMVKFLAQGHKCHNWDSNPHSADFSYCTTVAKKKQVTNKRVIG